MSHNLVRTSPFCRLPGKAACKTPILHSKRPPLLRLSNWTGSVFPLLRREVTIAKMSRKQRELSIPLSNVLAAAGGGLETLDTRSEIGPAPASFLSEGKTKESQTRSSKRAFRELKNWRVQPSATLLQPFANQPFANLLC